MSPIDDELRHTLHQKSSTLAPPPDVFVGVEQRARRIRRRRVAVTVTGSALAVLAIAVAVPAMLPTHHHKIGTAGPAQITSPPPAAAPSPRPSPSPTSSPSPTGSPTASVAAPANVLTWPVRGTLPPNLLEAAKAAYVSSRSSTTPGPTIKLLYGGTDAAGTQYLLAQAWQPGDSVADTVGFIKHPDGSTELQLNARADADTNVLAVDVVDAPAGSRETLVVVPQPTFGQALYAADGSHFVPVTSDPDGVVVISRDPKASNDKLRLLDGDGKTFFDGAVLKLLCGVSGCG